MGDEIFNSFLFVKPKYKIGIFIVYWHHQRKNWSRFNYALSRIHVHFAAN